MTHHAPHHNAQSADTTNPIFAVGCDIETTDLNVDTLDVLEVSLVAFDSDLNVIDAIAIVIHHELDQLWMNGIVAQMHTKNNLLRDVENATWPLDKAEAKLCEWMDDYINNEGRLPYMLGSSLTFDRNVLARHMPELAKRFHYRSLDATTVKILAEANSVDLQLDTSPHRALDDTYRSAMVLRNGYLKIIDKLRAADNAAGNGTKAGVNADTNNA